MNEETVITATQVGEDARLDFLPRYCGPLFGVVQSAVFNALTELSVGACQGGYWEFYELSNGGFFMAPIRKDNIRIVCTGNGYDGGMTPEAAGITATMFAIGRVLFQFPQDELCEHYYRLRDYAMDHDEAWSILAAID